MINIIKNIFWVSLGEDGHSMLRGQPSHVLGHSHDVYKYKGYLPQLHTH